MTVILSPNVVLDADDGFNANNPIIGYEQLATISNITSFTAETNYPVTNLVNPSTYEKWIGETGSPEIGEEYITITVNSAELIDYVAIAGHNFYTGLFPISIEVSTSNESPDDWTEVNAPVLLGSNRPVIFRFSPQSVYAVRIRLQTSQASTPVAPQAAVVYVGKLLILQRRIYVGHTPLPYGRKSNIVNGFSQSGNFMGRVVLNESLETSIEMKNILPSWYRTYMEPFVQAAQERPFFFNWRPGDYPYESGYCWTMEDVIPVNELPNGMMSFDFTIKGISG